MNFKHGFSPKGARTPEYRAWVAMKSRCLNPNRPNYDRYGGRGIGVHRHWIESFEAFLVDVGMKPPGTSLGRIDNDGDYEPGNVRWETAEQQQNNRCSSRFVEIDGITKTATEWARQVGLTRQAMRHRLAVWPKSRWLE